MQINSSKYLVGLVLTERITRISLIPRPHPLMRRNGLVKQVKPLGLVHTFYDCVTYSNIQNLLRQTCSKKVQILEERFKNLLL